MKKKRTKKQQINIASTALRFIGFEKGMPQLCNLSGLEYLAVIATFLISFGVYLHTLTPTIGSHDSGDMITAAYVLGIPHPPGYPLYCLLGKLWITIIPFGNIAFRMNIFSSVSASLTVMMVCFIVLKFISGTRVRWVIAAICSFMLAFSSVFWQQAIIAEKYTLNAAFITLLLFILIKWQETMNHKALYIFALCFGLAFTHHLQSLFLIPTGIYFVMAMGFQKPIKTACLIKAMLLFLAPLVLYLYLPIRASHQPEVNWGSPDNIHRLIEHLTAQEYRERYFTSQGLLHRAGEHILGLFPEQFGWLLAFSIIGACILFIDNRRWAISLLLIPLADICYSVHYTILNIEDYYIPSFVVCSILTGYGIAGMLRLIKNQIAVLVFIILIAAFVVIEAKSHYFCNDKHKYYFAWDYGMNILHPLKPEALLIMRGDAIMFPLWYLQYIEKRRNDVVCIFSPYLDKEWHIRNLESRLPEVFKGIVSQPDKKAVLSTILNKAYPKHPCYALMDEEMPQGFNLVPAGIFHAIATNHNLSQVENENLNSTVEFNIRGLNDPSVYQNDWRTRKEIVLNYASAYNNCGIFYARYQQLEKAISVYRKAIKINPGDVTFCVNLARAYLAMGRIDEAIKGFKQALLISPDNAGLHNDLGSIYGNALRYEEAILEFKKAKQVNPQDIKAYQNLSSVYYRQDEYGLAMNVCQEGLRIFPQDTYLQKMLGVLRRQ
ncbi:MAG: DUF2723 domain-containing protein [bacterium]